MQYRSVHWSSILEWSAVGLLIAGGIAVHQHHEISRDQSNIRSAKVMTADNNRKAKHYTVKHLIDLTDATQPNIQASMSANKARLTKGLRLAFNDCHTKSDYQQEAPKIKKILGNSLSSKILPVVAPTQNNNASFAKLKSLSDNMTQCDISYGLYNKLGPDIPLSIVIKYQTPPFDQYAGIGGAFQHHASTHTGNVVINATYFTGNHSVQVNNAYSQISK